MASPRIHRGHSQGRQTARCPVRHRADTGANGALSGPSAREGTNFVSKSRFHAGREESGGAAQGT
jgi:hypothetical protein